MPLTRPMPLTPSQAHRHIGGDAFAVGLRRKSIEQLANKCNSLGGIFQVSGDAQSGAAIEAVGVGLTLHEPHERERVDPGFGTKLHASGGLTDVDSRKAQKLSHQLQLRGGKQLPHLGRQLTKSVDHLGAQTTLVIVGATLIAATALLMVTSSTLRRHS